MLRCCAACFPSRRQYTWPLPQQQDFVINIIINSNQSSPATYPSHCNCSFIFHSFFFKTLVYYKHVHGRKKTTLSFLQHAPGGNYNGFHYEASRQPECVLSLYTHIQVSQFEIILFVYLLAAPAMSVLFSPDYFTPKTVNLIIWLVPPGLLG